MGVYLRMYPQVKLGFYSEYTWEYVKSVLGSKSYAHKKNTIEMSWKHIVVRAGNVQSSAIQS